MYVLNFFVCFFLNPFFCFFLPRSQVENIKLLTTVGWHQGKAEAFADVEEDTENIFRIKGLNYCMGFMKFHRPCRHTIVYTFGTSASFFEKGREKKQLHVSCSPVGIYQGGYLYFEILCIVWGPGVLFWPNNSNIDFRILEFWCIEQTAEQKPPALSSTTAVLLYKLAFPHHFT